MEFTIGFICGFMAVIMLSVAGLWLVARDVDDEGWR